MNCVKLSILTSILLLSSGLFAQEAEADLQAPPPEQTEPAAPKWAANFEVTFVSRFIWRGLRLGEYASIQPNVTVSKGKFFTGIWASHALALTVPEGSPTTDYKEVVPYVGFGFKFSENVSGSMLALGHYNPNAGGFLDYSRNGELTAPNNRVELRTLLQAGSFDFTGAADVMNDPTGNVTLYLEFGYTLTMPRNVKLRPLVSFTPTDNYYTSDGKADVTQIGLITAKSFSLSNQFDLTAKVDMIYNPDRDDFYTAFGLTAKF
ncbi:MAG: hypothetical protein AAF597_11620 [Bacteroidota bacterium]